MKRLIMATAFTVAALSVPAWAQAPAPAEHDSHHPSDSTKSGPAATNPAPAAGQPGMGAPQGGMGGMPMMGMMKGMTPELMWMEGMGWMSMQDCHHCSMPLWDGENGWRNPTVPKSRC